MLSCGSAKPCGRRPKSTSAPPYVAEKQFYQQPNYYSVAANTTGRMVQLAAGATPPAWDALQRGLGELRGALSEDLSRFFRDEARWAPSEARQELAKWFLKKVHGATTGVVDELRQGGVVVQPS